MLKKYYPWHSQVNGMEHLLEKGCLGVKRTPDLEILNMVSL